MIHLPDHLSRDLNPSFLISSYYPRLLLISLSISAAASEMASREHISMAETSARTSRDFKEIVKDVLYDTYKTSKHMLHSIISPSPYHANSFQVVRRFQEQQRQSHRQAGQSHNHRPRESLHPAGQYSRTVDRGIEGALALHNRARREAPGVKRPDMKWSTSLSSSAQAWAEHLAATNSFKHGIHFPLSSFFSSLYTFATEVSSFPSRRQLTGH